MQQQQDCIGGMLSVRLRSKFLSNPMIQSSIVKAYCNLTVADAASSQFEPHDFPEPPPPSSNSRSSSSSQELLHQNTIHALDLQGLSDYFTSRIAGKKPPPNRHLSFRE